MALSPSFAGVILAAGASSRMGRDKALLPWQGGTFLSAAIQALQRETELVIVVAGKNASTLEPVIYSNAAFLVENPHPELGQMSSLQRGLEEVLNRGRDAAVITLVDRPAPRAETVGQIKSAFLAAGDDIWAAIPEYAGRHGHPIIAGREMIEAFVRAPATSTARDVEHSRQQHILYVPVDDPLVTVNVNTEEDYEKLRQGITV
ncbi:MAG TPA: nucleotidyltransferase family protein [Candidatus Acidoferrales bacterium]|nr:nucleotidyltransferase family protein [Candidatus Acidoferrales bacterium]